MVHGQNVLWPNIPNGSKHPPDIKSHGQKVPWDKMSHRQNVPQTKCPKGQNVLQAGLGIRSFRSNQMSDCRLWAIRSDRSRQMSHHERIAQVAQRKWATVSESLRPQKTNEQPWAVCSGRSEEVSKWANFGFTNLKSCFCRFYIQFLKQNLLNKLANR